MPAAPVKHLLYLHGFRSSPQSTKARLVGGWLARERPDVQWWCPQLPPSPAAALALLTAGIAGWPPGGTAVVGSSLGGWYATVLAERHPALRAVLFNPAVEPARDLRAHIGETRTWHGENRFYFAPAFVDELTASAPPAVTAPTRYKPIIATGDEVLDWREMQARYAACDTLLIDGSDHALTDFDVPFATLLDFLGLRIAPAQTPPAPTPPAQAPPAITSG